jgi:tungstate transport system permease protein
MDPIHEVLGRSALVSLSATAIALAIGVPLGSWLALARVRGRSLLAVFLNTGMAIPTVVVGLVVALLLWRSGPLGNLDLIYTLRGMVIAQVLIATPLIAGITMAGLLALPAELADQLRALGANRIQLTVRLWIEARVPLLAAAMAGFGHAISEVGAATIVGGNIHGQTQVMTTSIVEDVGRGDFNEALIYAVVLLGLAFAINGLLTSVQQRAAAWAQS